ncbi:MAG: hypothetical protein LBD48_11745 [Treponema sp.]|jgi:hypothetical protein|nr:hypothetical protein [Treponema sp.]
MKKKPSVDELQSLLDAFVEKIRSTVKEEIRESLKEILNAGPGSDNKITEYDKALMNFGLIDKNFIAIQSAPKIAIFLIEQMHMEDLKHEVVQRYIYKKTGRPFEKSTARKAVTLAKSK